MAAAVAQDAQPRQPSQAEQETLPIRVHLALEKDHLDRTARPTLRAVAAVLRGRSDVASLQIMAYTDPTGSERHNVGLSACRAENVKRYLVGQGISPAVLQACPQGPKAFRGNNQTHHGRDTNRRVEFVVMVR